MISEWQSGSVSVSLLRVNGRTVDPQSAKLHAMSLLAGANLCPASLPPSAIVCIRKLHDPMPSVLSLDGGDLQPPMAWQRAVSDAIEDLARRAARPLREFVPANADCVVFNDRAELMACLAKDWCEGLVALRWWWRVLLPQMKSARIAPAEWLKAPEYVPGAWQHLANAGQAVPFAARLRRDETREMLIGILRQFALVDLQAVISSIRSGFQEAADERIKAKNAEWPIVPWQRWAVESDVASLSVEQRMLVGVALTLQRAPSVARTRGFAQAVRQWLEAVSDEMRIVRPSPRTSLGSSPQPSAAESRQSVRIGDFKRAANESDEVSPIKRESRSETDRQQEEDDRVLPLQQRRHKFFVEGTNLAPAGRAEMGEASQESEGKAPSGNLEREGRQESEAALVAETMVDIEVNDQTPSDIIVEEPLLEAQISTAYGGLFYLLNFGHYLELYGDITTPWVRDIPLGIWDFLALLGERLAGYELRRDPLWALLAQLAGGGDQWQPGDGCAMPENWRAPSEWLKPFEADGIWQWSASEDRLCVRHPAGFVVLDVALVGDPVEQLHHEIEAYAAFSPQLSQCTESASAEVEANPTSLSRWMGWLTPYARARLQRALGLDGAAEVGRALCCSLARVFITATHLDVVFSLAELMVEIRLAGLDRDPGWIPATGRIIRFHFEG